MCMLWLVANWQYHKIIMTSLRHWGLSLDLAWGFLDCLYNLRTFFLNITRLFLPFVASAFVAAWNLYLDGFSRALLRTRPTNWLPVPLAALPVPFLGPELSLLSSAPFPPFSCFSPHELHNTSASAPFRHIVVSVVLHVSHIGFTPNGISPVFLHSNCWKGLNMVAKIGDAARLYYICQISWARARRGRHCLAGSRVFVNVNR